MYKRNRLGTATVPSTQTNQTGVNEDAKISKVSLITMRIDHREQRNDSVRRTYVKK